MGIIKLMTPVKILHGDKDIAVPAKYAWRAASLIQGSVYREFVGCGHWLPRERPDDVVTEILAYVNTDDTGVELHQSR